VLKLGQHPTAAPVATRQQQRTPRARHISTSTCKPEAGIQKLVVRSIGAAPVLIRLIRPRPFLILGSPRAG
jgi:hypothetical protein